MATITPQYPQTSYGNVKVLWETITNGDDGGPVDGYAFADRSVQVLGTFGSGGTVIVEGSNDGGTTWAQLTDPGGTAISFTAAGIEQVLQWTEKIRVRCTAGDGTTDLDAYLFGQGRGK